jgi:hypothetical protein
MVVVPKLLSFSDYVFSIGDAQQISDNGALDSNSVKGF